MHIQGNGGHAKVVKDLLRELGWMAVWGPRKQFVAVGNNLARMNEAARLGGPFATLIHPRAIVSKHAVIGEGSVVMAGAVIQAGVEIGKHVIVNTGATVDHDCVIDDYAHIAPGVHLCGGVFVGEGALMGVGSCAIPKAHVREWSVVKAGEVVL